MSTCRFINEKLNWLMVVDNETIPLASESSCEYLAKKFEELGYKIEWDREQWRRDDEINRINKMTHLQMCRTWRFARPGHHYFDESLPYHSVFMKRFNEFGGFTPALSKQLMEEEGPNHLHLI